MQSLVVKISNPDTVHAIAETAKRQGTTPEATALELLETAILAQKSFEEIVEPFARSFDESGMSEEELDDLVTQTQKAIRKERTPEQIGDARTYSPRRLLTAISSFKESPTVTAHDSIRRTSRIIGSLTKSDMSPLKKQPQCFSRCAEVRR
jgi:hypothetical protein